ncbi:YadA family autotransporter adhesin, partial [Pseudomonas sp. CGJS7]|uniref:YadA family autotransporter adhesin n=1 Tax=Pseudomonas sp. CGJS7 TaxID=3109348 RepID=UPI00300B6783
MNTIYRIVWSKNSETLAVASQLASGRKKSTRSVISALLVLATAGFMSGSALAADVACTNDDGTNGRIQCGNGADARADNASAYGNGARATGGQSTAIGDQTLSQGVLSTAIGAGAASIGNNSTAIGFQSKSGGVNATALGKGANADGNGSVAVGGNATASATASGMDSIAIGAQSSIAAEAVSGIAMGRGAQISAAALYGIALGDGAAASAEGAMAMGSRSVANHANSVAIGASSATTVGAQSGYDAAYVGSSDSTGQVQVGGRTIGGVAAGLASDDAVNVSQLQAGVANAVNQANTYTDNRVNEAIDEAKSYTDNRVNEVAGNIAQSDSRITALEGDVTNVKNGSTGLFQVSQDNIAAPTATGNNAAAGGAGATASGNNSTALGNGARALASNAVALGNNSVADQANTVSVGGVGNERRVTNVAAGTVPTDAANVGQLNNGLSSNLEQSKQYTDRSMESLKRDAWSMARE